MYQSINKSRINKPRLRKAIAALRSGKYEQGTDCLKEGCKFCVLGVLADVSGLGTWEPIKSVSHEKYYILPEFAAFPREGVTTRLNTTLQKYYGFDRTIPYIELYGELKDLVDLNDKVYKDSDGNLRSEYSFSEIADLLEKTYLN